ncbi:MAG: MBL fold metallo-hydrolase [Acidobacteriota bacterium]|nr:MBL fold metallo-hydrolase [Acidobacteriota bacterium]
MSIGIEFWGVRGTFPSPGQDKIRYGGHTLCASRRLSSEAVAIIDAGTGIRPLGDRLMRETSGKDLRVFLFLTHFHLDHIIGFPFFAPLYSSRTELTVLAATDPEETREILAGLMKGRAFPLDLDETPCRKTFRKFEEGLEIADVRFSSCPLRHPQGSTAFRLDAGGASVVMAMDTEHPDTGVDEVLAILARGADHLVYDATYTPEEYNKGKKGWGHSTWLEGTRLARAAGVGHLVLSHWNPDHSDEQVEALLESARREFPRTLAAAEGMRL